jgi:hypothetical protein
LFNNEIKQIFKKKKIICKIDLREANSFCSFLTTLIEENTIKLMNCFPIEITNLFFSLPNGKRLAYTCIGKLEAHIVRQLQNQSNLNVKVLVSKK